MHKIKYVNDFEEPMSSKNKTPWISLNGDEIADTQIIMEYLADKFGLDTNPGLSNFDKAVSRSMRFLLEQELYWVAVYDRWVLSRGKFMVDFFAPMTGTKTGDKFILGMIANKMTKQAVAQGTGRHARPEIEKMGIENLNALSTFLGDKEFMMGDQPTELDCVLFGFMCVFLHCTPKDNIYTQKIEKELNNLRQHADRMIELYWPDWQDVCYKCKS